MGEFKGFRDRFVKQVSDLPGVMSAGLKYYRGKLCPVIWIDGSSRAEANVPLEFEGRPVIQMNHATGAVQSIGGQSPTTRHTRRNRVEPKP